MSRSVTGVGYSLIYDDEGKYISGSGVTNPTIRTPQGVTGEIIPAGAAFYRSDLGYALRNVSGVWSRSVGNFTELTVDSIEILDGGNITIDNGDITVVGDITSDGNFVNAYAFHMLTSEGATFVITQSSEEVTLSTGAATTDTDNTSILAAGSIILAVVSRVTTAVGTAASFTLGDATTAARFGSSSAVTLGATITGLNAMKGGVATDAAGPVQASNEALRITCNTTPSAGKVRVTVFSAQVEPPTS